MGGIFIFFFAMEDAERFPLGIIGVPFLVGASVEDILAFLDIAVGDFKITHGYFSFSQCIYIIIAYSNKKYRFMQGNFVELNGEGGK